MRRIREVFVEVFTAQNISAGYNGRTVLKNINLAIREGEFLSIIGPNGAGKSTMVKVLSGDIRPVSGSLLFRGSAVEKWKAVDLARGFSTVHQSQEQVLPFTVYDFVRMGRFPHQGAFRIESDSDARIIGEAIEITGLTHLAGRKITELSGGEFQLAGIAHALAQNREVIILDEPVSHLDIRHSVAIMDILYELNRQGSTIITVLHDMNMASDYCKRIVAVKAGEIFFDGPPEIVFDYRKVEELFDSVCIVRDNPITGKPFIYPVPEYIRKNRQV